MTTYNTPIDSIQYGQERGTTTTPDVGVGTPSPAVSATVGFLQVPRMVGAPSGVPAAIIAGMAPIAVDSTNGRVWAYYGAAWHGLLEPNLVVLTYAAPISLDPSAGTNFKTTTVNATGSVTINALSAGQTGQILTLLIENDATSGKVITFGTNFRSVGTLTGIVSKGSTIAFMSDGTNWIELHRIVGTL